MEQTYGHYPEELHDHCLLLTTCEMDESWRLEKHLQNQKVKLQRLCVTLRPQATRRCCFAIIAGSVHELCLHPAPSPRLHTHSGPVP